MKDATKIYWSDCSNHTANYPPEKIVAGLSRYIERLEQESQFGEFVDLMEKVHIAIAGKGTVKPLVSHDEVKQDAVNCHEDRQKPHVTEQQTKIGPAGSSGFEKREYAAE